MCEHCDTQHNFAYTAIYIISSFILFHAFSLSPQLAFLYYCDLANLLFDSWINRNYLFQFFCALLSVLKYCFFNFIKGKSYSVTNLR